MESVIRTEHLTKRFGDFTAVDEITFEVSAGEIFGFLGANGAGKTTAMRMLIGLSKPSSGKASVAGYDVYRETEKIKKNIGYMSQKFSLYEDLTVLENIRFSAASMAFRGKSSGKRVLRCLNSLACRMKAGSLSDRYLWDGNRNYHSRWRSCTTPGSFSWMNLPEGWIRSPAGNSGI